VVQAVMETEQPMRLLTIPVQLQWTAMGMFISMLPLQAAFVALMEKQR
jgi:hypothetical protein